MNISLKILVVLVGILFSFIFFSLARKKSIKPFYTTLWLLVTLFIFSLVIFEKFYKWVATQLGITDASFLVIVGFISFLLLYVLYLSIKISVISDRIQELISHSSILENEIRIIKKSKDSEKNPNL
ncbi:MAG: hypothetical protein CVT98_03210 [Bacteroidetes bacterium HGW-Bacteroidetes-15]|nr:MAG: hypothetical protein CVT98_03210 [Bacteroidetes bacterium HGW-Bacteroidetes-15]